MEPSEAEEYQQFSDLARRIALRKFGATCSYVSLFLDGMGKAKLPLAPAVRAPAPSPIHPVSVPPARASLPETYPDAPWHTDSFEMVTWKQKKYTFSGKQAAIVKRLWQAWEAGRPEVESASLLRAADSDSTKVASLFQGHPAMHTLIRKAGKTCFRLAFPSPGDPAQDAAHPESDPD